MLDSSAADERLLNLIGLASLPTPSNFIKITLGHGNPPHTLPVPKLEMPAALFDLHISFFGS